jgi:hypothetical protein
LHDPSGVILDLQVFYLLITVYQRWVKKGWPKNMRHWLEQPLFRYKPATGSEVLRGLLFLKLLCLLHC